MKRVPRIRVYKDLTIVGIKIIDLKKAPHLSYSLLLRVARATCLFRPSDLRYTFVPTVLLKIRIVALKTEEGGEGGGKGGVYNFSCPIWRDFHSSSSMSNQIGIMNEKEAILRYRVTNLLRQPATGRKKFTVHSTEVLRHSRNKRDKNINDKLKLATAMPLLFTTRRLLDESLSTMTNT